MPEVSIIIPAYNAERTIGSCLFSITSQTFEDYEIIVCDDASRDGTVSVVQSVSDSRVQLIHNEKNLGPGPSRDHAISRAKGKWIAFIDADDAWLPGRLEEILGSVEPNDGICIWDDIMICYDVRGELVPWRPLHARNSFGDCQEGGADILLSDYVRSPRLLIKPVIPRSIVQKHNIKHSTRTFGEDAEFFIKVGLAGAGMRYLPKPMYLYRTNPGSITATTTDVSAMRRCMEDCLQLSGVEVDVRKALLEKIDMLRMNESLYSFFSSIRSGSLLGASRILGSCPSLLRILPKRAAFHILYQFHRMWHGGSEWR